MVITASDRSSLIRLASSLPKGTEERRAILSGLIKVGMEFETQEAFDKYLKEHPKADQKKHSVKPTLKSPVSKLEELVEGDQKLRGEYQEYLKKYPKWQDAAAAFRKDKGTKKNDLFGDAKRVPGAQKLIKENIEDIKKDKKGLNRAWLLVQHMDNDVAYQKWFLQHLKPGSTDFKYLTDRVLVNTGKPQKYNTQNEG